MPPMIRALESVVSVLLMISLGFVLAKKGWFEGKAAGLVSKLVVSVALPAYMVANLLGGYDRAKLLAMLPGLPIPFAVMLGSFALARLLARLAGVAANRRGTFASMFSLSNAIFIGLPVNVVLFGEESLPYVLLYYIANTTTFWTIGVYGIAKDGTAAKAGEAPRIFSGESFRRVLSPPLLGFLFATALILVGLSLPDFLLDLCATVGSMTTPLSMIFVGITIAGVHWKALRPSLDMVLVLAGRFLVSPLLLLLLVSRTELPLLMKEVFLIQAAMPAMTQTPIIAKAYGADAEYAGLMTSVTTIASLATIPLYMGLIGFVFG
jgi:predicted permease